MLGHLVDDDLVPQDLVDPSPAAMGATAHAPNVIALADRVDAVTNGKGEVSLYRRFYVPTSALFVHVNAPSLVRHVGRDARLHQPVDVTGRVGTGPGTAGGPG